MRQRPHIDGDWHVYVYLDLVKIAAKLVKARNFAKSEVFDQLDIVAAQLEHAKDYHVSLSKSLYLKAY